MGHENLHVSGKVEKKKEDDDKSIVTHTDE